MKKISLLALGLMAFGQAFAQTAVCTNGTPQGAGAAPNTSWVVVNNMYVVRAFPIRCSANVTAVARENAIAFAVGATSLKGKSYFQGTTGGGAVAGAPCSAVTCVAADADNGLQTKLDAAT